PIAATQLQLPAQRGRDPEHALEVRRERRVIVAVVVSDPIAPPLSRRDHQPGEHQLLHISMVACLLGSARMPTRVPELTAHLLLYVHKRFVSIPLDATPDGDVSRFDRTKMVMEAVTYDEMRPGCYQVEARIKDFELNWVDGSLPFPTFPRFCGQTFYEAEDKELSLACVQAYNDWMVEEWCDPSIGINIPLCIMPLWDVALAAKEIERNANRGVRAICFSELPTRLDLPSIHTGYWDPMFAACNDTGTTVCMHVGSSSTDPASSKDAPAGVGSMVAFNNSMASLGDYLFSGKMV